MKPRIYSRNMELVGVLQHANKISYHRTHNDLYTGSFELPFDDPKTVLCDTHFIVDIFDGDISKGKYRILDEPDSDISDEGEFVKYSCEHVIAFLMDDVIDGYLETGGEGCTTRTVLEQLLSMQGTQRWVLGRCDFDYEFQYSWENTNLLDAVFSIPTCFADAYHWTYDTDSYPWTLNLVHQDTDRSCEIRRKRNMQQIKRSKDSSALCTRLYCKGNGEGVNQLTIKEVNGGKPYIEADTIGIYGPVCKHYIDLTVTDAETLLAKGRAILDGVKHPRYTYTAKAADLSKITGRNWDEFDEGKYVHLIDDEKALDLDAMIIEVEKPDIDGDPLDVNIVISNKSGDISSDIEDLARRTAITAQYSQGATALYSQQFVDNASPEHPAIMRVYVPAEAVKINQVLISVETEPFRAFATGAESGGGTTATSESGGGQTATSAEGGATTITSESGGSTTVSSASGGDTTATSESGGSTTATSTEKTGTSALAVGGPLNMSSGDDLTYSGSAGSVSTGGPSSNQTSWTSTPAQGTDHLHYMNNHTHTGGSHSHSIRHYHTGSASVRIPALSFTIPSHTHRVSISSHKHNVTIGSHSHNVNINNHSHNVRIDPHSHSVKIDPHTHDIEYGIFEGDSASNIAIEVDGNTVPNVGGVGIDSLDIVRYMDTDSNGKIVRGTWHEIKIVPDSLTRIIANLFVKTFVTSYSGGNY